MTGEPRRITPEAPRSPACVTGFHVTLIPEGLVIGTRLVKAAKIDLRCEAIDVTHSFSQFRTFEPGPTQLDAWDVDGNLVAYGYPTSVVR